MDKAKSKDPLSSRSLQRFFVEVRSERKVRNKDEMSQNEPNGAFIGPRLPGAPFKAIRYSQRSYKGRQVALTRLTLTWSNSKINK